MIEQALYHVGIILQFGMRQDLAMRHGLHQLSVPGQPRQQKMLQSVGVLTIGRIQLYGLTEGR